MPMRARGLVLLVVAAVLATGWIAVSSASPPNVPQDPARFADGVFLVKFRDLPAAAIDALNRQTGAASLGMIPGIGVQKLSVPPGRTVEEMLRLYDSMADVVFAEPNFIATTQDTMPNDALFSQQWGPAKIKMPAAWDLERGSSSVLVAVVDTGVDCTHPDLQGHCVAGFNTVRGKSTMDDHGHGTHVSGILGAMTNNVTGVAGVNWQAAIMPVKVLNKDGFGTYGDVAEGIAGAADRGARVINLSLGGSSPSDTLRLAVDYAWGKGVFLACAAGNSNGPVVYPAAYGSCTAVGATDQTDQKAWFSSYGAGLAVTAPGVGILSTVPKTGATCCSDPSGYKALSGTSMATPHVAGLAALLFDRFSGATNADVRNQMAYYADDLGFKGWDKYFGYGRINAYKAVSNPLAPSVPPPPPPATAKILSPTWGATVSGTVTIQASVGGSTPLNVTIGFGRWDASRNICKVTTSSTSVACTWDTSKLQTRYWTIGLTVTDARGDTAADTVRVYVR
jgi:thermitase